MVFVDVMQLFNHGSYILIKFLRLIGENVVLRDQISFFNLNMELCTNFLIDVQSFLIHMLVTVYHTLWQNESWAVFVTIVQGFHSTDVSASCGVRNWCTVMSELAAQSINRK